MLLVWLHGALSLLMFLLFLRVLSLLLLFLLLFLPLLLLLLPLLGLRCPFLSEVLFPLLFHHFSFGFSSFSVGHSACLHSLSSRRCAAGSRCLHPPCSFFLTPSSCFVFCCFDFFFLGFVYRFWGSLKLLWLSLFAPLLLSPPGLFCLSSLLLLLGFLFLLSPLLSSLLVRRLPLLLFFSLLPLR